MHPPPSPPPAPNISPYLHLHPTVPSKESQSQANTMHFRYLFQNIIPTTQQKRTMSEAGRQNTLRHLHSCGWHYNSVYGRIIRTSERRQRHGRWTTLFHYAVQFLCWVLQCFRKHWRVFSALYAHRFSQPLSCSASTTVTSSRWDKEDGKVRSQLASNERRCDTRRLAESVGQRVKVKDWKLKHKMFVFDARTAGTTSMINKEEKMPQWKVVTAYQRCRFWIGWTGK